MFYIYNEDCVDQEKKIADGSIHLGIYDPPFGLGETAFDKYYKRDSKNVIEGYREAPDNYEQWTHSWLSEAKRVLHPDGSMYVIMGHSNLRFLLNAANILDLHEINHIIWKFNFGVNTKKKYVTSHYHILYYSKSKKSKHFFNTYCRFGQQEKDDNSGSLLYQDMQDVFIINKEYAPGKQKNENKLPEELIRKIIQYSSKEGQNVCDFFMGNFTTAYVALKLGRNVYGYEINEHAYNYHIKNLKDIEVGSGLINLKKVENISPKNQGKKISPEEAQEICNNYKVMVDDGMKKRDVSQALQKKFGRGRFSIKNILDDHFKVERNVESNSSGCQNRKNRITSKR